MPKPAPQELLYDPMPRPDVQVPPISEPQTVQEDARRLVEENQKEGQKDFLSNLAFR